MAVDFAGLAGNACLGPSLYVFLHAGPEKSFFHQANGGFHTRVGDAVELLYYSLAATRWYEGAWCTGGHLTNHGVRVIWQADMLEL